MTRRSPWERRQAELAEHGIVANLYTVDRRTRAGGAWLLTLKAGDVVNNRELRARVDDQPAAELEALELTTLTTKANR
jgi:hypothetical protein